MIWSISSEISSHFRSGEESEVLRGNRAVGPCDPRNYILFKMPFDYLDLVPKLLNVWKISFTMTLLFFFPPHSHRPKMLDHLTITLMAQHF
jgi:hypothetical protein